MTSFDAKTDVLKVEWTHLGGAAPASSSSSSASSANSTPKTAPKSAPKNDDPKAPMNGLQSIVGKAAKGTFRFSPIWPTPRAPKNDQAPTKQPETIQEGPTAAELRNEIKSKLDNIDDVEK